MDGGISAPPSLTIAIRPRVRGPGFTEPLIRRAAP
jgi:hypothetical protein